MKKIARQLCGVVEALFENVCHGPHVESDAVLVVMGIREDGYRQRLGAWCGWPADRRWSASVRTRRSSAARSTGRIRREPGPRESHQL
ncbi:MAG: hypothetical protein ACOC7T_01955 [Planctomycetota bacterium]